MTTFLNDHALIERIYEHKRRGTTDTSGETWREPVSNYLSEGRLEQEIALLRRIPIPFCPSAALPKPTDYVARAAAGVPLLVVRDHNGVVRAFRNSCRHRGTALLDRCGSASSLQCPYHHWTYRLDGSLASVPHEDGFPGLDKSKRGLVSVDALEHGGVVYVCQEGEIDRAELAATPELIEPDHELLRNDLRESVVEANWKLGIEGIEGYHIRFLHKDTFFPYGYDNLSVVETHGRYMRITFPFRRVESLADQPADQRRIQKMAVIGTVVIPNVTIVRTTHGLGMNVLEPISVNRTRQFRWTLTKRGTNAPMANHENGGAKRRRDRQFLDTGEAEDNEMLRRGQLGLQSRANEYWEFGHWETPLVHFHRQLDEMIQHA